MSVTFWFNVLFFLVIFNYAFSSILEYINDKSWKDDIPETLKNFYSKEKYKKAKNYKIHTSKVSLISSTLSFVITIIILSTGIYGFVSDKLLSVSNSIFIQSGIFFFIFYFINLSISIPIQYYSTFVIEEKYGFNKSSKQLFFTDQIKRFLMTILIGSILLYCATYVYSIIKEGFWIFLWIGLSLFLVFLNSFYASLIVPIFNKLTPIDDGSLKTKIQDYSKKIGYSLKNIFIIDGSKRSSKANAFFSGLGPKKTIALYDTLIENHTDEELLAVLAHEVGHYKKNHISRGLFLSVLQIGLISYLFELCTNQVEISNALGGEFKTFHLGLIGFSLLYSPISILTGVLMNMLSRKNEFEADNYAKSTYNGEYLSMALKKLSADNLSNLYPHPLYVFIHYSHPPLIKRLEALSKDKN
jgi:STE24 endopeptidase